MMLKANPGIRPDPHERLSFDPKILLEAGPGQVAFLHKPFTPAMLAGTVDRLIRGGATHHAD